MKVEMSTPAIAFAGLVLLLVVLGAGVFIGRHYTSVPGPGPSTSESTSAPAQASSGTVEGEYCTVDFAGVDRKWADAFAAIYDVVYDGYREILGLSLPEMAYIEIRVTGEKTRLYTDGIERFFLLLEKEEDLLPTSAYRNVYGFAHEPGHIVMYSRMKSTAGLPEGVAEGWAHYAGSVIVDYLWERLGEDAYPVPHDYSVYGTARLKKQSLAADMDATTLAATTFYAIGDEYGHDRVGAAMGAALEAEPTGNELMPRFRNVVQELLGGDAAAMIPEALLKSRMRVDSSVFRRGELLPANFFSGQRNKDGWLSYDDDSNEGKRSIAGGGHAVLFRVPGERKLKAVMLKGGRYGPTTSETKFTLTILDAAFESIARFEYPFMDFPRGEELEWTQFDARGTSVSGDFFVCFDFNPTATDGVYVGIDESSTGHSFNAVPGDHLFDLEDGEWMIRALVE